MSLGQPARLDLSIFGRIKYTTYYRMQVGRRWRDHALLKLRASVISNAMASMRLPVSLSTFEQQGDRLNVIDYKP